LEEYAKLDAEDESIAKWKASLGIGKEAGAGVGDASDPRKVIVLQLRVEIENKEPIVIEVEKEGGSQRKVGPFQIEEGSTYTLSVRFRVQHEIISGLKYVQVVKRKGITLDKLTEMLGSYLPNQRNDPTPYYEKKFPPEQTPTGILGRGTYDASAKFVDDDNMTHVTLEWSFEVVKKAK